MEPESQLPQATPPQFADRRTGLLIFGIFEILIGALCALFIPLMLFGQTMAARATGAEPQYRLMLPGMAFYGLLAAMFVTLGIGSILARRWARALSLILAWSWLVMGVVIMGIYSFLLPKILGASGPAGRGLPEGARVTALVVALTVLAVIFVVLPGVLVFFYQSRHVKATCEARDPVMRWTDASPLPVVALSLWLLLGGISMLAMPAVYRGVAPFFGVLISGVAGTLFYLVVGALWIYSAWASYRRQSIGWWIILAVVVLFGVSNAVTFARVDLAEMYRLMDFPPAQIAQIRQFQFLENGGVVWLTLAGFLPLLVYLLWVKRYFRSSQPLDRSTP